MARCWAILPCFRVGRITGGDGDAVREEGNDSLGLLSSQRQPEAPVKVQVHLIFAKQGRPQEGDLVPADHNIVMVERAGEVKLEATLKGDVVLRHGDPFDGHILTPARFGGPLAA
jgi:hypothetical protein